MEGKAFTVKVMSGYTESDRVFIVVQYFTARCRAVRKLDLVHNVVQIFASRLQATRSQTICLLYYRCRAIRKIGLSSSDVQTFDT